MSDGFDMSAEEILAEQGRESLEARVETLRWVLGHDDPDLSDAEQADAEERLAEFEDALGGEP